VQSGTQVPIDFHEGRPVFAPGSFEPYAFGHRHGARARFPLTIGSTQAHRGAAMRLPLPAAGIVLATCLAAAGACAQTNGEGTLGGQVLGTDGTAAIGARVTLQPSDGRRPHTTETNGEGHFWFPSLARGLYDVRAYHNGRWSDWHRNVWVERGKQSNVTLRLRPKKPVPANSPPASSNP
jgi:hypothetical protein